MKYRCACGKPDTMEYGIWVEVELDNLLHFKAADRECERCGRPLCKDCQARGFEWTSDKSFITYQIPYCPICAEAI